ncbi:MAG: thiamine pyrophosphate-requiring protein [Burkholderiales bacterium]|nr:MAG: thiamine pyrophosphate-requiring protein [Burkholderiales bacterium]
MSASHAVPAGRIVAERLLERLAELGVDCLFGNAGTDFAPVIEAYARARSRGARVPEPIAVPHENLAVSMAHGYYHATGRPQAVMVHVNVGTANALCALFNARRDNIPVLVFAGRTPLSDGEAAGSRSVFIHWGQEMFDQAGMVREAVKWDYELRMASQVDAVLDRAYAIAMSEPRAPVYVTLPREVLALPAPETQPAPQRPSSPAQDTRVASLRSRSSSPGVAAAAAPDRTALARLAEWLATADCPLAITASHGRRAEEVERLAALCTAAALPLVAYRPRYMALPSAHPMLIGYEPAAALAEADLVIALDCDVPWIPRLHPRQPGARFVQIGPDPLFASYPLRSFPCDLAIAADTSTVVAELTAAVQGQIEPQRLARRQARAAAWRQSVFGAGELPAPAADAVSSVPWVARCLNRAKRDDDILVIESVFPLQLLELATPGTLFGTSPAGGLGWGLGESIGLKLADRSRRVIAVVGDGTYMFGNPTPAHYMCAALQLPVLTVILNNGMWGAVRRATLGMYPDGAAAADAQPALTMLEPAPRYERVVEASGGYGECVERAADLPAALERAFHVVEIERRQAVLNVLCHYSDEAARRDALR